jgi:hypothetical protein
MRLAATSSGEGEEEAAEMIDVPENMQRLTSFLRGGVGGSSGGRLTMGRELAAAEAAAVADLELEARSLLKHMSIGGCGGETGQAPSLAVPAFARARRSACVHCLRCPRCCVARPPPAAPLLPTNKRR